jgi:hypothetical protein
MNHPQYDKIRYADIEPNCKTGDLILFHCLDNMNAAFMGSYYTHIGIVYRESPQSRPYIYEAWNPYYEIYYPKEIAHGMAFTDLENRISSYRGYVFYKPFANHVSKIANVDFYKFIYWGMQNMKYNRKVIENGINKLVFNDQIRKGINCGELVYLSLIKLGILDESRFYENRKHHLRWVCNLVDTDDGGHYLPISYIWQNYFIIRQNYSSFE